MLPDPDSSSVEENSNGLLDRMSYDRHHQPPNPYLNSRDNRVCSKTSYPNFCPSLVANYYSAHYSSGSSSSLSELQGICNKPMTANSSFTNNLLPTTSSNLAHQVQQAQAPRKQHTLDSIEGEKSQSRSPIVTASLGAAHGDEEVTTAKSSRHKNLLSPFYKNNNIPFDEHRPVAGPASNSAVSPVERISLQSFERRRSIYESDATLRRERHMSLRTDEDSGDQLSLGQILADIEAGKVADQPAQSSQQPPPPQRVLRIGSQVTSIGSNLTLHSSPSSSKSSSSSPTDDEDDNGSSPGQNSRKGKASDKRRLEHEMTSGFEIVWLNFTYSVEPNILEDPRWGKINSLFHKERRTILKGLSGGLRSGQMVALMGPSGAGKTCLLECISGVRMTGLGGQLRLRGRKSAQLVIVPQYDDFMPQFTVEEIIAYGSKMKNPFGTDHKAITDQVIEQLGLQICRTNNIQSCSGGQRKRVAIAQELVSRPNILILDEPTSGLDSSCCYQTMSVLRNVLDQSVKTEEPMAIVTTIHQPSAKVFKMFDSIYLLGKTGYAAYSGPPDQLLSTIRDVTGLECPQYSNPSDYMIELVSYDYGEEPVEKLIEFEKEKARMFVRDYEARVGVAIPESSGSQQQTAGDSPVSNGVGLNMVKLTSSKSDTHLVKLGGKYDRLLQAYQFANEKSQIDYKENVSINLRKATSGRNTRHPFFWHTFVHMHRSFLQSIRDPILNNMRILIHLGFAILLVLLYGKKSGQASGCPPILGLPLEITDPNNDNMIDLADNVGYLFMCIMMITYVSLMSTVLTFPIDIKTVGKEYKNGWYGTLTYFLGKSIADLPFIVLYPVIYCLITWYLTNQAQDHAWRYFSFTGLIILNAMNSQSFGLILGALFVNSVTAATFLGPVITIPWYLFTGFTKRVHRLAEPFKTTSKFLFTRYIFEGLLDTVYGHQRCNCSAFLQKYHDLRYEEALRLGQLISAETLSSLDYYDGLEVVAQDVRNKSLLERSDSNRWFEKTVDAASTMFGDGDDLNLAGLMETNVKASSLFSFGLDFEPTCPANYKTFVVQDFRLADNTAQNAFIITLVMVAGIRLITYALVSWKIRTRQL